MDQVNVAYPVEQRIDVTQIPGALAELWRLIVHYPVPSAIVVGVWLLYTVWAIRWSKRQPREPKSERATLRGTAQVLSFKKTRGEAWNVGYLCIIELAVHIPGREQYVTVVRKLLRPEERAAVQRGETVQVRVDPDDDPKNVRIDLDAGMPPQQQYA